MKIPYKIAKGCYTTLCPVGQINDYTRVIGMVGAFCDECKYFNGIDRKMRIVDCSHEKEMPKDGF